MQTYTDYLMTISLPDDIAREIGRYKRATVNLIGHFEGMHATANIIVCHKIRCKPFLAQPAIAKMGSRLCTMPPAILEIANFGYCNEGYRAKTIYAVISLNERTKNWLRLLCAQMDMRVKDFEPRIIIAKRIPTDSFHKLWPNFEDKNFSSSFTVNSLTILHRDTFVEYSGWTIYRELFFGNRLRAF